MSSTFKRCIYVSEKSPSYSEDVTADIRRVAARFNRDNHITGLLVFNGKYFLQVLEGPERTVNSLMSRIMNDARHINVCILVQQDNVKPEFDAFHVDIERKLDEEERCDLYSLINLLASSGHYDDAHNQCLTSLLHQLTLEESPSRYNLVTS